MSEPQRETRFAQLHDPTERLRGIRDRGPKGDSVESSLISLVEKLEETAFQTDLQIFVGENFDNHADMRNLASLKKDLEQVAAALEKALATRNSYFRW